MKSAASLSGLLGLMILLACSRGAEPYQMMPTMPAGTYRPSPTTQDATYALSSTVLAIPSLTPTILVPTEVIKAKLGEPVRLQQGQIVELEGTNLSAQLLKIGVPEENCFDCPRTATVMVKSSGATEEVSFQIGLMSQEAQARARNKPVFGFIVSLLQIKESEVLIRVDRAQ